MIREREESQRHLEKSSAERKSRVDMARARNSRIKQNSRIAEKSRRKYRGSPLGLGVGKTLPLYKDTEVRGKYELQQSES